jgi:glucose/arabinose dehydrogenase
MALRMNHRFRGHAAGSALLIMGCHGASGAPVDAGRETSTSDATHADGRVADVEGDRPTRPPDAGPRLFSGLPGSVCFGPGGKHDVVPGGRVAPSLDWLQLPDGFCAHYFAHVPTARQLRFAPGGELFVASPSRRTGGGAPLGIGAIVVLYDDDGDGFADGDALPHGDGSEQSLTVFTHVVATQGLLFTPAFFYYQDDDRILKVAYETGQRRLVGTPTQVADITVFHSKYHWPKVLDVADDGTLYVGNGGDQAEICDPDVFPRPFHGGVLRIDGTPGGTPVAQGFRNPIAIRCEKGRALCFSVELGLDGSGPTGGREKIVPIRDGDDWGYPCCATKGVPYAGTGAPNCSLVASETVALEIGNTPFGIDFEPGLWPAPYTKNMLVTLHGEAGDFAGERVIRIVMLADGMPEKTTDIGPSNVTDFATGWDGTRGAHGRPAAVTFAPDGRAFIANDFDGDIFWVAPVGLAIP